MNGLCFGACLSTAGRTWDLIYLVESVSTCEEQACRPVSSNMLQHLKVPKGPWGLDQGCCDLEFYWDSNWHWGPDF